MRFKIVSAGWRCAGWWEQTLRSIQNQTVDNWDVQIMYDGGDNAGAALQAWCDQRDERWNCQVNDRQQFAVRNQLEAIRRLDPADDDIVVFVDLDGDQLAHSRVLERLAEYYTDGALVTFGSYRPMPVTGPWQQATDFPADVIRTGTYRQHTLTTSCCWNHLRTISGRIVKAIPADQFRWANGPQQGDVYRTGTDYIFMTCALELADGRHAFIPEILLLYNNANPYADYLTHPADSAACTQNFLRRSPLAPLFPARPAHEVHSMTADPILPPEQRRAILADYGRRYGLTVFVETGTAHGDTPAALRGQFDQLYTIELDPQLHEAARRRFRGTNVHCLHGDSGQWLPKLRDLTTKQPVLFWLDGHFCGGARADKDTPVMEELAAIFATGIPHVILIDDARIFGGMSHAHEHDWPHIDDVRLLAEKHDYRFVVADDIIRLTPA